MFDGQNDYKMKETDKRVFPSNKLSWSLAGLKALSCSKHYDNMIIYIKSEPQKSIKLQREATILLFFVFYHL